MQVRKWELIIRGHLCIYDALLSHEEMGWKLLKRQRQGRWPCLFTGCYTPLLWYGHTVHTKHNTNTTQNLWYYKNPYCFVFMLQLSCGKEVCYFIYTKICGLFTCTSQSYTRHAVSVHRAVFFFFSPLQHFDIVTCTDSQLHDTENHSSLLCPTLQVLVLFKYSK